MLDRPSLKELQRLREEIQNLKNDVVRGAAWAKWYRDVSRLLGGAYGLESDQLKEFHAIRFEPTSLFHNAEQMLSPIVPSIEISEQNYYLERLSEADECLLALSCAADPNRDSRRS